MKSNITIYNGKQYHITVLIYAPSVNVKYDDISLDQADVLIADNIEKIEFENDISNPMLIGEIIYKDNSNSILNPFLSTSCKYINISIVELENSQASTSLNTIRQEKTIFNHTFLVTTIDKIDQKNDLLYYSIKYVSAHWWNFNSNIVYSTHNTTYTSEKNAIDILKDLYIQSGLNFDINKVIGNNKIHFISDTDETLFTAQRYLLKRVYNLNALDIPGLTKVVYDHITNRYLMWSLLQHSGDTYNVDVFPKLTPEEVYRNSISIPLYNKYIDSMQNQDVTTFDILNFKEYSVNYDLFFNYTYRRYNYITNTFSKKDITNSSIIKSLPQITNDPDNFEQKYYDIDNMLSKVTYKGNRIFNRESSQWDEHHWPYDDVDNMLLNNGVLRINTAGNLLRKTGDNTFLTIDKTDTSSIMNLKGNWINMRVVHTFSQNSYRNTMLLCRINVSKIEKIYTTKEKNEQITRSI